MPVHGHDSDFFFKHFGIFAYIAAASYQADEINEEASGHQEGQKALGLLRRFLSSNGMADPEVLELLRQGEEYFAFERTLMCGDTFTLDQALAIAEVRSVDLRIMHRVVFQLTEKAYDRQVLHAFHDLEVLMELEDDIASHARDRRRGTFNVCHLLLEHAGGDWESSVEDYRSRLIRRVFTSMNAHDPPEGEL